MNDSIAVTYAAEVARWGIETSIVVPGAFTKGTNHFLHAGAPADQLRTEEYAKGPTASIPDVILKGLTALEPKDADPAEVARGIVKIIETPLASDRSASTSIPLRMVPRSSTAWRIASERSSYAAWAWKTS
jgi:hypothetical protein